MTFKRFLALGLIGLLLGIGAAIPVGAQGSLSRQVLLLLERDNTWTGVQTYDETVGIKIEAGSNPPTGGTTNRLYALGTTLYWNGTIVTTAAIAGGTVTSVALTAPSQFAVAGSPITGAGTLALTWNTVADNLVFAGPNGGGPLAPTFRALADADVPNTITIDGASNVTWASVNKAGSSLADLATRSAGDLSSGTLALARFTDGGVAGVPLVAGGGGGDPNYAALDLSTTAVTGLLAAARFPVLTGDVTTPGGSLATTLATTGVAAATYGSSTQVPQITVDTKGRITAASNVALGTHAILSATHSDVSVAAVQRGALIYGNATPQWARLAVGAAGRFLRSDGTDVSWGTDGSALTALNASNISSGTLAVARGGTGGTAAATLGGAAYGDGTALAYTAAGAAGQCLTSNGAAAPTWGACATLAGHNLLSVTHSDTAANAALRGAVIIGNSTPAWSRLAIGTAGYFLRSDGTDVSWGNDGSALTNLSASALTSGTVPLARISGIGDAQIAAGANISPAKLYVVGGTINQVTHGDFTWDPPNIVAGSYATTTAAATGVSLGDTCTAGITTLTTEDVTITAHVQASGTIKVTIFNPSVGAVNLGSGTVHTLCFNH